METHNNAMPPRKPKRRKTKEQIAIIRTVLVIAVTLSALGLISLLFWIFRDKGPQAPATLDPGQSAGAWAKNEQGYYFNDADEVILPAVKKGIDVSKYQGEVDWGKAKAAGIDFAIIRCGFGSEWNGEGSYAQDDEYWKQNADGCTAQGIPFGTYLYSYATTEDQARLEADHVARLLGLVAPAHEGLADYTASPYKLDYPVYYDLEDKAITGLFPEEMAALTAAFFDQLESHGYKGAQGIYASLNWTRARLSDPAFDAWRDNFWIARFASNLEYTGPYAMWQASYTEPGAAYGVQSETVDIDFVMEELTFTGITDAKGQGAAPSFTNDTKKNELWLGQEGDRATLQTDISDKADEVQSQRIFWTSSDETIATVDKKGTVHAKAEGECTVTATLADGRMNAQTIVRVGSVTVPIYATGALHGQSANDEITLADLAALKGAEPDAILLDAGGSVQGTANTSLTGGMDMTSAFSAAGYDLQAFDSTDLAFGSERLLEDSATAAGPSLAANLRTADGTLLFHRATSWSGNRITNGMNYVLQEAGKKIGFFALSSPGNYAHGGMVFNALEQTANEQVAALTALGVDAIICITGPDTDAAGQYKTLAGLGVNAVIAADQAGETALSGTPLPVLPAGNGLARVGRLAVQFGAQGGVTVEITTVPAATLQSNRANLTGEAAAEYQETTEALDELTAGDAAILGNKLFTFAQNPGAETTVSFANYVASLYEALADGDRANWPAEYANTPLYALAGGITELEPGDITRGTLLSSVPSGARLRLVATTAAAFAGLLDTGAATQTYEQGLIAFDMAEGPVLLITDTETLKLLPDPECVVLRDYGDVFWDVRMNINDVTENFANEFTLPEAPRYGAGRGDL